MLNSEFQIILPLVTFFGRSHEIEQNDEQVMQSRRANRIRIQTYTRSLTCNVYTHTHTCKHIPISIFCINLVYPTSPISNVSRVFLRSLCDKFVYYAYMCVSVSICARVGVAHTQIQKDCLRLLEMCVYIYIHLLFRTLPSLRHLNDFGVSLPKSHNVVAVCCCCCCCLANISLMPVALFLARNSVLSK